MLSLVQSYAKNKTVLVHIGYRGQAVILVYPSEHSSSKLGSILCRLVNSYGEMLSQNSRYAMLLST